MSSMMTRVRTALVAVLLCAGPATAAITHPSGTGDGNGDFTFDPLAYGSGGLAYLSTLLYVADLGNTQQPATQVLGTAIDYTFSSPPSGLGSSVVELLYSFTNTSGVFTWSDLRFMVNVQPDGSFTFLDLAGEKWPGQSAGDPDRRQIGDFTVDGVLNQMQTNDGTLDGTDTCGGTCDADLGLEWRRATLAPGETWTIALTLVDDPSLVVGGRYLSAQSDENPNTTHLFVGNPQLVPEPQTYAMLLAGLGLLAFLRVRKT